MAYTGIKFPPLTPKEIEEKYKEAQEEMKEVLEWKKEEEERFANPKSTHQAKSAAQRAFPKVERRINTVKGNILYWKLRKEGKSHFHASLERAEFWDKLKKGCTGDKYDVCEIGPEED
jgi:mannitol-1-phosphate/altronate dehydrogenase